MSENVRMSRRDWFRLRPPQPVVETPTTSTSTEDCKPVIGQSQASLQPVAFPENHGRVNLTELSPMCEGVLSVEQVRQLFSDIESLASKVLLMQRSPNAQRATTPGFSTPEQLRSAETTLLSGATPRIQIRYHWESVNWIDTLESRADGIRLVRIKHTPPSAAGLHPRSHQDDT